MTHHSDFDAWQGPSTENRIKNLEASNAILRKAAYEADQRADRAFKRGTIFGGLLIGGIFIATAAFSLDISGSTVTLEPSADPDAFADVVMHNAPHNGPKDTGAYTLSQDGLAIGLSFVWDASFVGADQITVTPPTGMTCKPSDCTATVIEGQTGRVTLFQFVGS